MTEPEKLVYAATFAQVYNENYPAYDHGIAIARAVKAAYMTVDALQATSDLLKRDDEKGDTYRVRLHEEFTVSERVMALYHDFMKESDG